MPTPRNAPYKVLQRELRSRCRMAWLYRVAKGQKFMTKGRSGRPMICDPETGQWWNYHRYLERLRRRDEARKRFKALAA